MSWSTSELRVRLAPLNRFKPSSKIFYWPFQGGTSFVDLLCFCSVLCLLCFVRVCLYVLRGHLLGKGWPLGSCLWCLLWVCHFPIGILGQVWYLIVSIPDLCNLTYFYNNSVYGGQRNFLYKNGFYKHVWNVIRFRGNQKYRTHIHGDDIQDALSPSTAIFWFISDETIYHNESWCLIRDVDGWFIYFCMK